MDGERADSWLLPDHTDRARMLDMDRRLQPIRRNAMMVMAAGLVLMGPWIGWWTLAPLAIAALLFTAADRAIDRVDRPEYWIFAAWLGSQLMIAGSVLIAWGPDVPVMAWFAMPVVTLSARFSLRGVVVGVIITLAMMVALAFIAEPSAVIDHPPLLVLPMVVVIAVGILSTALMRSDMQHRGEAVIDPLTAMLNRKALNNRVAELQAQSSVTGAPVGVVITDIDHFKRVNDTVGHATGDAVLRDVAYTIRKDLRAFELAYRLGGEEFLILLPGADLTETMRLAEGVRTRIEEATYPGGLDVTVSCGISASRRGEPFDFDELCSLADQRLYEAKRLGRNRVHGPLDDRVFVAA